MKLPYLDQTLELERGEAQELAHVVGTVCLDVLATLQAVCPWPMPPGLLLALPALLRVANRCIKLSQQEFARVGLPRQQPHKFRLSYDELVALMLYVVPKATSAFVVLGKVHQKSLNLDLFVDFTVSH